MDFSAWKKRRLLRNDGDLLALAGDISSFVDGAADSASLPGMEDEEASAAAPETPARKPLQKTVAASSPQTESGDDRDERSPANEDATTEERAVLNDPRASAANTDMRQSFDRMSNVFLAAGGLPQQPLRDNPYKSERDSMRDWLLKRQAGARAGENVELQGERTRAYLAATAAQRERDLANQAARAEAEGRKADAERHRLELEAEKVKNAKELGVGRLDLDKQKLDVERKKLEKKSAGGPKAPPKGFPAGWELEGNTQPTPKQGEQFEGLVYSSEKMKGLTAQMRQALKEAGSGRLLPGATRSRISQLAKEIQIEGKNIAELGALSGPDYSLMEAIAADPTKLDSLAKDMPGLLDGLDKWGDNSVGAKAKSLGARRIGQSTQKPAASNDKVTAARKWLAENPNHPDAPAVRKKLEAMGG